MKITVDEIRAIPPGGSITRTFDYGNEAFSAANTVQYVKRVYPRQDGKIYSVSTDWKNQKITISVVDP